MTFSLALDFDISFTTIFIHTQKMQYIETLYDFFYICLQFTPKSTRQKLHLYYNEDYI